MFKVAIWKIPFLLLIGILAWTLLFPSQFMKLAEVYSDHMVSKAERERLEKAREIHRPDIVIESICDERLAEHAKAKVLGMYGCTLKACPSDSPCCNFCFFMGWKIEGTSYVLNPKLEAFSKCSLDGCGAVQKCPSHFILGDLRKSCSAKK